MNKVTVEFNSIEEAQIAVAAVRGGNTPVVGLPPAPAAYTPPAAPAPVYQAPAPQPPAAAPPVYTPPAPVAAAPGVSLNDVAAAAQKFASVHGPKNTKAVFAEFNAGSVKDIPQDQWANAIARMAC